MLKKKKGLMGISNYKRQSRQKKKRKHTHWKRNEIERQSPVCPREVVKVKGLWVPWKQEPGFKWSRGWGSENVWTALLRIQGAAKLLAAMATVSVRTGGCPRPK